MTRNLFNARREYVVDGLCLSGILAIAAGLGWIYPPLGVIWCGAVALCCGIVLARK